MRVLLSLYLLVGIANAAAAGVNCEALAKEANDNSVALRPPETHRVQGSGRLYFFSAPNALCKTPAVFVIPGDQLVVYSEQGSWYQVMYLNAKTSDDFEGWVEKTRLKYVGTVGPR